ncbi:MAG: flagellar hook-associated protein FlgK [Pseudohongiellaceae bacterium]|jgi:flagellar hook-associated protein FlgK
MTDLLSIGASSTQLYRVALSTVSNNIANLNNEAYSRQETAVSDNAPARIGAFALGTGARLDAIRRNYDRFVENALRQSNSALQLQQPLIEYTKRIVDLIAAEEGSLTNAVDRFFSSVNRLELDPSSVSSRNELLASGQFLTGRMRGLADELADMERETASLVRDQVDSINTLAKSLLEVNRQLDRVASLQKQPSQLLDQRDKLLRELSAFAAISVSENANGSVQVRLAGAATRGLLVDSVSARVLDMEFGESEGARQGFVLDKYGAPSYLGKLQEGSLAGLVTLRDDLLEPMAEALDFLAVTLVSAGNAEHRAGLDLDNQLGTDMFSLVPRYSLRDTAGDVASGLQARSLASDADPVSLVLTFLGEGSWLVTDSVTGDQRLAREETQRGQRLLGLGPVEVEVLGPQSVGASVVLRADSRPAQVMAMAITDPRLIAAAGRLGVRQDPDNASRLEVALSYGESAVARPPLPGISLEYMQKRNLVTPLLVNTSSPVVSIPRGLESFSIGFMAPLSGTMNLHVVSDTFARLASSGAPSAIGSPPAPWATAVAGTGRYGDYRMTEGALNQSYPGTELFIGARATGALETERLPAPAVAASFSAGDLLLNGQALDALSLPQDAANMPAVVAAWLNAKSGQTGVIATADNVIRVASSQLMLDRPLVINGTTIAAASRADTLALNINAADTGVRAFVDTEGYLHLTNKPGEEGKQIKLGDPPKAGTNALGMPDGYYNGTLSLQAVIFAGGVPVPNPGGDIRFTLGTNGIPSDLTRIGLATTVSGSNGTAQDLHVYLTGSVDTIDARLQAGALAPPPPRAIEAPLRIDFSTDSGELRYTLTDITSGTVLHKARFDFDEGIVFGDVRVRFGRAPQAGDSFDIVPNLDALGDNSNLRRFAALENATLFRGQTLRAFYVNEVDKVGTASQLAEMSAAAGEIVYNENVEKRAAVAGVNLDQEAADLIRFQQAFQAAAQVIQVSTRLFDAILGVR